MFCCFSLLFSSSSNLGPVQKALALVFTTSQWIWSFPVDRMGLKIAIELYKSVPGLMISYEYFQGRNAQCFLPFPFLIACTVMQPRRSVPQPEDNVTATCNYGWVIAILYSWLAMRLRSLVIILCIHLYLLSLESTVATVYHTYHMCAYKAERWRTCSYNCFELTDGRLFGITTHNPSS